MTIDSGASPGLRIQLEGGVATLTFDRPEARNAANVAVLDALLEGLRALSVDESVRCVVLTGAGDRAFCAGGDVGEIAASGAQRPDREPLVAQLRTWSESAVLLHEMPKPTLAVVNGVAAGAGLALALACDLRIASSSARFVTAFARIAMCGDFGGSWFLTQLVGSAKARELYYLSDPVSADEALRLGLVNRVVEPGELRARAGELAARLAAGPASAYRLMKRHLNAALGSDLRTVVSMEAQAMIELADSPESRAAVAAFFGRR